MIPTNRPSPLIRQEIRLVEEKRLEIGPPRFNDLSPFKQAIDKHHVAVLTADTPQDRQEAQRLFDIAMSRLAEAEQVNASHQQATLDRQALTNRLKQLHAELQQAEIQERCALRQEAEEAYKVALGDVRSQGKDLCRAFHRLVEIHRRLGDYGHGHVPSLPRFTLDFMKNPQDWDSPCTSEQIQNNTLLWLAEENGTAGTISRSTVSVGSLPMPNN